MRRALALLPLAFALVPALAWGQTVPAGQVRLANNRAFPNFINAAECAGAPITVRWTINGTFPAGGQYALYASNVAHDTSASPAACHKTPSTTGGIEAGQIGSSFTGTGAGGELANVNPAGIVSVTKKSCSTTAQQAVFLCVEGKLGDTVFGLAESEVVIHTAAPPAPRIVGIGPGDGALILDWDPGAATSSADAETQEIVYEARPVGTTTTGAQDPRPVITSERVTQRDGFRFDGLVNSVRYSVRAFAFSKADNISDPSLATSGVPEAVSDFWESYKAAGGQELGGCASGAAGPLGLALLAATLALVRRKK